MATTIWRTIELSKKPRRHVVRTLDANKMELSAGNLIFLNLTRKLFVVPHTTILTGICVVTLQQHNGLPSVQDGGDNFR